MQSLDHCRRHGKNTRIAGRNHHDRAAGCGKLEGMTCALHFLAIIGHMHGLVGAERPRHADIGLIAKDNFGAVQSPV